MLNADMNDDPYLWPLKLIVIDGEVNQQATLERWKAKRAEYYRRINEEGAERLRQKIISGNL
jgi:hypothetical protein